METKQEPTNVNTTPIKGELTKTTDVIGWDEKKFDDYFIFAHFWYEEGKIKVTKEKVLGAYQYVETSPFFAEMLERIDKPIDDDWTQSAFYLRLASIFRIVKMTVVKFPTLLQPLQIVRLHDEPQWKWMHEIYDQTGRVKTKEVVVTEEATPVDTSPTNIQLRLAESMARVADVYDMIASSITDEEIRKLKTMDRINALQKLSYIHANVAKFKPNVRLTQINVGKGTKEDLESVLLDFTNDQ